MIKNTKNKKVYIGQTTKDFKFRYGGDTIKHVFTNTHNELLKFDIRKYGYNCWDIKILESMIEDKEQLCILEETYIEKYNSTNTKCGYNKARVELYNQRNNYNDFVYSDPLPQHYSIICLDTGEIYSSVADAGYETGINKNSISRCVKGKQKTAGGKKFALYNSNDFKDYEELNTRSVISLHDDRIFHNVFEAARFYLLPPSRVASCCRGPYVFTEPRTTFLYTSEYYKSDLDFNYILDYCKIRCSSSNEYGGYIAWKNLLDSKSTKYIQYFKLVRMYNNQHTSFHKKPIES